MYCFTRSVIYLALFAHIAKVTYLACRHMTYLEKSVYPFYNFMIDFSSRPPAQYYTERQK